MDIPCKWDSEEADAQEWDEAYDNETQTEYHVNMILITNEYHKRKYVFIAKHPKSDAPSTLKQEPMYMITSSGKGHRAVNLTATQKQG
jgi:hypothetical protein